MASPISTALAHRQPIGVMCQEGRSSLGNWPAAGDVLVGAGDVVAR
jgi:hypothetical protein